MNPHKRTSHPPAQSNLIQRPRVDALLRDGMAYPAVVVAAGAGFGKTQAVASFLESADYRKVWLQLTALDNLPMRFWESFAYTCSLHRPVLGDQLRELGFPDTLYKFHRFLQHFTDELYADNRFVVFVFDDFQVLTDPDVRAFFVNFTAASLENLCLVFLTRDLGSYSLHHSVYVLTAEDLLFTPDECAAYLAAQGLSLTGGEQAAICGYAGGWAMALYLIAVQLRKEGAFGQASGPENRLLRSKQLIFDLIDREVFSAYTPPERAFFLRLSALNFFPRPLVLRIAAREGIDAARLLALNAFVSFDAQADHYYLHQTFLDYLAQHDDAIDEPARRETLLEAASWCAEHGYRADAIDYYDRCGDYEGVWAVIEGFEGMRRPTDEAALFIRYIERFPEGFLREHPMCRIVYAMLLFNNLQVERAQSEIELAFAQLRDDPSPEGHSLLGEAHVAMGLISLGLETHEFVEHFRAASELLPGGSRRWGKNLHLVEHGNALNLRSSEPGEVEKSLESFFEGMPLVSRVLHGAGHGLEHLAAADASFLRGDVREALTHAYKAYDMAEEQQQSDIMDNALFLTLRAALSTGDDKSIEEILARIRDRQMASGSAKSVLEIALGWFYSELGNVQGVASWILYDPQGAQPPISVDRDALVRVRCLIEERKLIEALAVLDKLDSLYRRRHSLLSLLYVQVYKAVAHYRLDEFAAAMHTLLTAYELSHGNGLVQPFVEYGHRTRALLDYARTHASGIPAEWLAAAHTKASTYAKRHAYLVSVFGRGGAQDFDLTQREVELLKNLSQGLTREEIAQSMYVSPNTVKSMLKTAYGKIGAVNSADAVRIAIGAGLI